MRAASVRLLVCLTGACAASVAGLVWAASESNAPAPSALPPPLPPDALLVACHFTGMNAEQRSGIVFALWADGAFVIASDENRGDENLQVGELPEGDASRRMELLDQARFFTVAPVEDAVECASSMTMHARWKGRERSHVVIESVAAAHVSGEQRLPGRDAGYEMWFAAKAVFSDLNRSPTAPLAQSPRKDEIEKRLTQAEAACTR